MLGLTTGVRELLQDAAVWDPINNVMLFGETGCVKQGGQCKENGEPS